MVPQEYENKSIVLTKPKCVTARKVIRKDNQSNPNHEKHSIVQHIAVDAGYSKTVRMISGTLQINIDCSEQRQKMKY